MKDNDTELTVTDYEWESDAAVDLRKFLYPLSSTGNQWGREMETRNSTFSERRRGSLLALGMTTIFVLSVFQVLAYNVNAAASAVVTNQSDINEAGLFPTSYGGSSSNAWTNHSMIATRIDDKAELALSVDVETIDYTDGPPKVRMSVAASANARVGQGYVAGYYETSTVGIPYGFEVVLGDDGGIWVDAGWSEYAPLWYYGCWYDKIYISANGYVILGDSRTYLQQDVDAYPSPGDNVFPSEEGPNVMIAPMWRDLNPDRGGEIYYGIDINGDFRVCWIEVSDKMPYTKTPYTLYYDQTFAVVFHKYMSTPDQDVNFVYGAVNIGLNEDTDIGMEDQTGTKGVEIDPLTIGTGSKKVPIYSYTLANNWGITRIKTYAVRTHAADTIAISGPTYFNPATGQYDLNLLPGGVNVRLSNTEDGRYVDEGILPEDLAGMLSMSEYGLGALGVATELAELADIALLTTTGSLGLTVGGFVLGSVLLLDMMSEIDATVVNQGLANDDGQAYVNCIARDERIPSNSVYSGMTWDASTTQVFEWGISDPTGSDAISIYAEIDIWNYYSGALETLVVSAPVTVDYVGTSSCSSYGFPQGPEYLGRSIPDGHMVDFGIGYSTDAGYVYHVDSVGRPSADYGYDMVGWTRLTPDDGYDLHVRPDGTIRVQGEMAISDTFASGDARRSLSIYAVASKTIPATFRFSEYTAKSSVSFAADGNYVWKDCDVTVNVGTTYANKPVKLGIGRYVEGPTDYQQVAEWSKNVEIFEADDMVLAATVPNVGGHTTSPNSYYGTPAQVVVQYGDSHVVLGTSDSGYKLDHWTFEGTTVNPGSSISVDGMLVTASILDASYDGTLTIGSMRHDYDIQAYFAVVPSAITVTTPNGGEIWEVGVYHYIYWTSVNAGSNVKIEWVRTSSSGTIIATTPNDGSYWWYASTSLLLGTDYKIRITGVEMPTVSDISDGYFTLGNQPTAPLNLEGSGYSGYVYLNWDPPSSTGGLTLTKYNVYRALKANTLVYSLVGYSDGDDTLYFDNSVTAGKSYYYYVTAVNYLGEGPASNAVLAKVPRN